MLLERREFLKGTLAGSVLAMLPGCSGSDDDSSGNGPQQPTGNAPNDRRLVAPAWLIGARVAGMEISPGQELWEIQDGLDKLADERVSVVELDGDLSRYMTDAEFQEQVAFFDLAAKEAKNRGMRSVGYYPTLEVLTPDADKGARTMRLDHPDWVQVGIDGKENYFIGGGGRVFWVDPGEESAWMCPSSGYVDYFTSRVAVLAKTALDGLWGDVPLLSDIGAVFPCINATCAARFQNDTGLPLPTVLNWDDPVFRRWVKWRHELISSFEQEILRVAKSVRNDFEVIIETVTMDYNAGTSQGLDGAAMDDGGVYRCWEVDAVSDESAMHDATANDWISMAVMMRHGKGATAPRPSWIFSYGLDAPDAEYVMALAIVTGNSPYETKIPLMCTSVGHDYRKRMYSWIERNVDVYNARFANDAAIIFSSASRDFLDRNTGVGLYASLNSKDQFWWSTTGMDLVTALDFMGDYRGTCKALIHSHVPYDVVTTPHVTPDILSRYRFVAVPSAVSLSDDVLSALDGFAKNGGTVLFSGLDTGIYDEHGAPFSTTRLADTFGLTPVQDDWTSVPREKGKIVVAGFRAGGQYFAKDDPNILSRYGQAAGDAGAVIRTNAPPPVVMDVRRSLNGSTYLLCANLQGLGVGGVGSFAPVDATFDVTLPDMGKTPTKVTLSDPSADRDIPFNHTDGAVTFTVTMHALMLATISFA
ncbi:beta-galactosidase trimerization domain-containing protein [Labilithrix luteola]|nr:beta-galactosidase trimerization domain-containing protein [Labilithrix luteola]